MRDDYLDALRIVRRYKRKLQDYNKEKRKHKELTYEEKYHRTIIYNTEDEIIDTIKQIENYLPLEQREYTNKHKDNKIIINDNIEYTYIPINKENLSEIISNEQYRKEFYKILEEELSTQQFKVISLYYGARMRQVDIASELEINKSNVSNYLSDANERISNSTRIKTFLEMV